MRRLLTWYLPLTAALLATTVFAYGFAKWLSGDTGSPVDFVPSESETAAAPRDVVAPIILGDSLARGAGDSAGLGIAGRLDEELRERKIKARRTHNVAVSGARTADLLEVLERPNVQRMLAESNVIIVSIGGNDLWGGSDWRNATPADPDAVMDEVLAKVEQAHERIRAANANARIFFVGLYNPFVSTPGGSALTSHVNQWNARVIERFNDDPNFTLVQTSDIFSHRDRLALDRFHPGAEGYALIARRIADAL